MIDPVIRERLETIDTLIRRTHDTLDGVGTASGAAPVAMLRDLYAIRNALLADVPPPPPALRVDVDVVVAGVWNDLADQGIPTTGCDKASESVRRVLMLHLAAPARQGGSPA